MVQPPPFYKGREIHSYCILTSYYTWNRNKISWWVVVGGSGGFLHRLKCSAWIQTLYFGPGYRAKQNDDHIPACLFLSLTPQNLTNPLMPIYLLSNKTENTKRNTICYSTSQNITRLGLQCQTPLSPYLFGHITYLVEASCYSLLPSSASTSTITIVES